MFHIENRWRLVLIEARRKHGAVVRVIHPLLTDRVAYPENRAAKHLAAKRARMNHRADVGVREKIHISGAIVAPPIAESATGADVFLSSLTNDEAVHSVYTGPQGVLEHIRRVR